MIYKRGKKNVKTGKKGKRQGKRRNSNFPRRIGGRRKDKERIQRNSVLRGLQFAESCRERRRWNTELIKTANFLVKYIPRFLSVDEM